jgi:hypothetical protein
MPATAVGLVRLSSCSRDLQEHFLGLNKRQTPRVKARVFPAVARELPPADMADFTAANCPHNGKDNLFNESTNNCHEELIRIAHGSSLHCQ